MLYTVYLPEIYLLNMLLLHEFILLERIFYVY